MAEESQAEEGTDGGKAPVQDDAPASNGIQADPDLDFEGEDSLMGEFLLFLKEEKRWWLTPMVVVLLLIASLFIFVEGSAVAPFIYTIF
jgi:hypothetical protein